MTQQNIQVDQSLHKARWVMPHDNWDAAAQIARRHDVPEIIARLITQRGIPDEEIAQYLKPSLREHFPDPFSMQDMEGMASYLAQAIKDKKSIAIFGDFDVDGATSSAILHRFLAHFELAAPIYIPDRLSEGYGPNAQALENLKEQGAEIVILLDCGTVAHDTVQAGRDMGLEIIILDHHEPDTSLPAAQFVINPKRTDDESGLDVLAACGVTFLACVAVNNKLRADGYFEQNDTAEPLLKDWLDLVALGTVCDMVPLTGVNRLLVRSGFAAMQNSSNTGLRSLIEVSGIKGEIEPYHAGFILGPRINAGSRVYQSDLGAKLLSTDDAQAARDMAWTLNDCNDKRKAIQAEMERGAIRQVEDQGYDRDDVIVVAHEDWHQGLSGLVAGRLKEKYAKPSCVISFAENMKGEREGRGSGRSMPGVHMAKAFMAAREAGLLVKGGGHAMAAGFTIEPERIDAFREFLQTHIRDQLQGKISAVETPVDAVISVNAVQVDLVQKMQNYLGPFGQEHPEPLFLLPHVRLHMVDRIGENHIKALISDAEGTKRVKAVSFRSVGTPLGDALLNQNAQNFHLLGHLKINDWQGRQSAEFHIRDAAFALEGAENKAVSA